jgi:hypothetical protein
MDTLECREGFEHEYDLHWLLADVPVAVVMESPTGIELSLDVAAARLRLCINSSIPGIVKVVRASNLEGQFDGWAAPTYGLLVPAVSVHWVARGSGRVTFRTEFVSDEV